MSDARQVPPAPGTEPRASKHRERPYREDPGLYSRHREAGTHPYTQDEIEARIVAHAADAATIKGSGPLDVPFLRELVAVFRHRLHRDLPLSVERRLSRRGEVVGAEVEESSAGKERKRLQRRRSELESTRRRTPRPVGGRKFTHPAWLIACLIPAVAIELLGSKSALEAAFDLDPGWAILFGASISAILVIAADQFGNALASIARPSRRWSIAITAILVFVAMLSGVIAISALAGSRATNTAFQALGERQAESGSSDFGAAVKGGSPAEVAEAIADKGKSGRPESAEADIGFFVPLSVLILATATLLAFRIEGAADWNEVNSAVLNADREAEHAGRAEAEALQRRNEEMLPQIEAEYELAAYVEREHALLTLWLQRFAGEYGRFCAAEGEEPRELTMPDVPVPGDVLNELLYPNRRSPQPAPRPQPPPAEPQSQSDSSSPPEDDHRPPPHPPRRPGGEQQSTTQTQPRPPRGRRRGPDGRPPGLS